MLTVNQVCDYIIVKCHESGEQLNPLKLQKLLYYVQAWKLAFSGEPLFQGKFQAWVHGPVNREIYDRFVGIKSLYSSLTKENILADFDLGKISPEERLQIDNVLEVYAPFSGSDLETISHDEEPWIRARGGCRPSERCETELDETFIASYYKNKWEEANAKKSA